MTANSAEPFVITLRGYDRRAVDALVRQIDDALASDSHLLRAAARDAIRRRRFRVRLRGYVRRQVDAALSARLHALS